MNSHRVRGFLSSIFRDHFDSDNPEWLEEHRKEIEKNVKKILKLINEEKEGSPNEGEELASLVDDFYKNYQILHERYDRLAGDIKKNVNGSENTHVSSSSSSSSDSESDKIKSKNDKGRSHKKSASGYKDLQTQNENLKHELEASHEVENDMKQRLVSITEERDNLMSQNVKALDRIKEADIKIEEFILASEQLSKGRAQLEIENSELKLQLETERNEVVDLKNRLEATIKEKDVLTSEILAALLKAEGAEKSLEDLRSEVTVLREESSSLLSKIEVFKQENSVNMGNLQQAHKTIEDNITEMEKLKTEISVLRAEKEDVNKEIGNLNEILAATHTEKDILSTKHMSISEKLEAVERQIEELNKETETLKLELSERDKINGDMKKEIEGAYREYDNLKQVLQLAEEDKNKLILENSEASNKLQQTEKSLQELQQSHNALHSQILDLEKRLQDKEEQIRDLLKNFRAQKNEAFDQIDALKLQISELESQHSSLSTLKTELEEQIDILKSDALIKQKEMEDIKEDSENKIRNLEQKYEGRGEELSNLTKMLEGVKSEASHQIDDLQLECSLLRSQKKESEEQMEKDLSSKILELEKLLEEKEELNRLLAENHRLLEVEFHKSCDELQKAESKIRDVEEGHQMLSLQMNDRTLEVASLVSLKSEMEEQLGKAKGELSELELQKEKLYQELQGKISDQERILHERDNTLEELKMKCKQLEDQVFDLCEKLKIAEQKIGELEEERQRVEESKDMLIQNMQLSIEGMKRDIETAEEEISRLKGDIARHDENYKLLQISAEDEKAELSNKMADLRQVNDDQKEEIAKLQVSVQNAEVQLRLSTRKFQITESEFEKKEEIYRKKEEEMHEKHKLLEEQVLISSEKMNILENEKKETFGKMVTAMKSLNFGFDNLLSKLDENYCQMDTRLSKFSTELQTMRRCVSDMVIQKQMLKREIHDVTERLEETGISKSVLEKKLGLLETTITETIREKNKLAGTVAESVKKMGEAELKVQKKEVEMEEKNEEKREAIRQLCIYIEYYRENQDLLKESLLKMLSRSRRR